VTIPSDLRTNQDKARWLIEQAHANNGLAPLDVDRFWADQEIARADPFGTDIPQVPMGIAMNSECCFTELGEPPDFHRRETDAAWGLDLERRYNDLAEAIVGRRLLGEHEATPPDLAYPPRKQLHDIFESRNEWHGRAWWLMSSASDAAELAALLDRVEARLENLRDFLLPPEWDEARERLMDRDIRPRLYRSQRGPVTFAMSVFGVENLIYLILDSPDLAGRFRDCIIRAMLGIAEILDAEAGYTPESAPHSFTFLDDNCCMLSPDMYEFFAAPILAAMFNRYAPAREDWRYQHSDSAMGHLLPILARFDFSQVNFGPTLTVNEIREAMPDTVVEGQLAPFTFSRNEEENIVLEFLRDYDQARERRGLLFATAGSVNDGSRLTGLRLIMSATQHFGRY
jgi:uroporphyrinogen decarboxylase